MKTTRMKLFKTKEEVLSNAEKELSEKVRKEHLNEELVVILKEKDSLQSIIKKERGNFHLILELYVAEQSAEMLNRDSNEHITTMLQNQLSKLREESVWTRFPCSRD
ncbi:hypothetical protein AVEN_50005-1 [Araneus ventricosus]|uniref:Uncharacterized protein n=1 Tax=Araneus ventricosus TaxID=182803 RepID=A0A4Y2D2F5_ARAVE|nr:hypothetical protein AVEN_50005-1 [Araneus ventricosus]